MVQAISELGDDRYSLFSKSFLPESLKTLEVHIARTFNNSEKTVLKLWQSLTNLPGSCTQGGGSILAGQQHPGQQRPLATWQSPAGHGNHCAKGLVLLWPSRALTSGMAEDQEEQWQGASCICLSTNICHPPSTTWQTVAPVSCQGGWWQMPGRSWSCLNASYSRVSGPCKSGFLLSFVAYFKAFLGSSFPIHTRPSQMHGSEFLQRGVTDQLLCHSTSVYQDTVTRTVIILGEKLSS